MNSPNNMMNNVRSLRIRIPINSKKIKTRKQKHNKKIKTRKQKNSKKIKTRKVYPKRPTPTSLTNANRVSSGCTNGMCSIQGA